MTTNGTASAIDGTPVRTLGGVELREDVPLKGSASASGDVRCCAGGPRLIPGAFAALSACITVALLTQIYCGDYEVVPHGSVSSSAAACSRAGTDALKAGGRAFDAAAATALCLAVLAPHRTSLDASGSMLYWEYRELRTQQPVLYEWGDIEEKEGEGVGVRSERAPRLVAALAHLHSTLGALPWARVLEPAIQLARDGFPVSEGLSVVEEGRGEILLTGSNTTAPVLADYLLSLQINTSAELSQSWNGSSLVRRSSPAQVLAGSWRVVGGGGSGAGAALRALQAALDPPPASPDEAQFRVVTALQRESGAGVIAGGVATGLAVVDSRDTYIALVTGISEPFGSGEVTAAGWRRDEPSAALDLAPAILYEPNVCGSRYVVGAESSAALAQAATALALEDATSGVERARLALRPGGGLALEVLRPGGALAPPFPPQPARPSANASFPYAAVNLVLQRGDALTSHADSRGGGLASRF